MDHADPDRITHADVRRAALTATPLSVLVFLATSAARLKKGGCLSPLHAFAGGVFPSTPLALTAGLWACTFLFVLGAASVFPRRWRGAILDFLVGTALAQSLLAVLAVGSLPCPAHHFFF